MGVLHSNVAGEVDGGVIEPLHARIFDPACGSGGMFVQSAPFVENHHKNPNAEITVYGHEKTDATVRLCKMNLAVHGLEGEIRHGNSYHDDIHHSVGEFDFVMRILRQCRSD